MYNKLFCIIMISTIAACSNNFKKNIGISDKNAHDEFNIVNNPPLSIPPNYDIYPPHNNNQNHDGFNIENKVFINKEPTYGERLLLDKIKINDEDIKSIVYRRTNVVNKSGFFDKLFTKKNSYSKDSTQDPEADEAERTYKNKSMQFMKNDNSLNKKICNIQNGEVVYCDKGSFIKKFSFSTTKDK